jgi:Uma2 family endonuclease
LLSVQNPLRLDKFNELEPDVILLRSRKDDYKIRHPPAADVLLLVEVSDCSLAYDRGVKLAVYARFKIPEVWIVNIPALGLTLDSETGNLPRFKCYRQVTPRSRRLVPFKAEPKSDNRLTPGDRGSKRRCRRRTIAAMNGGIS